MIPFWVLVARGVRGGVKKGRKGVGIKVGKGGAGCKDLEEVLAGDT
jgi:hypothetical protein